MSLPSDNKNQIVRSRTASDPAAFSPKPMLDENRGVGGFGQDKRQETLEDVSPRGESSEGEQRTAYQDDQPGTDARAPFIQAGHTLPEGLRREPTHPLSPTRGRGDVRTHVPSTSRHIGKGH